MKILHLFSGVASALVLALGVMEAARAESQDPFAQRIEVPLQRFPTCCPRPAWWDAVGPVAHIQTMDGFLQVWQDKSLSAEHKAKALFQVIEDHQETDDELTASAVTYYGSVDWNYPYLRELLEFGVGRYLDYDRSLERYSGRVGDLSAGMVRKLAKVYIADGEPERAVPLLEHILGPRRAAVNDQLLELAALELGVALGKLGREPEAVAVLLEAKRAFHGDWEPRLDDQLGELRQRMGPAYYLHDTRFSLPALVVLLGAILAAGLFWRRQPRIRR